MNLSCFFSFSRSVWTTSIDLKVTIILSRKCEWTIYLQVVIVVEQDYFTWKLSIETQHFHYRWHITSVQKFIKFFSHYVQLNDRLIFSTEEEIFRSTYVERRVMNNQSYRKYLKQMHWEMSNSSCNMSHRLDYLMKDDVIQTGNKTSTSSILLSSITLNCYYQGYLLSFFFFLGIFLNSR